MISAAGTLPVRVDVTWLDYSIIALYFIFVLGIGAVLRKRINTSEDYLLSARTMPSWVTGLAYVGANVGALEVLGEAAGASQYGFMQAVFLWFGGVGGMLFMGLFMMPFYYRNRIHSVPGYFRARYNEPTRGFNATTFALFVILNSGINMYAMALVFNLLLGWTFTEAILLAGVIVIIYTALGGLSSSIYNEALQFFLMTLGLVPLLIFGLIHVGGWDGLQAKLHRPDNFFHIWAYTGTTDNPYGVQWFTIGLGIGFAISFSYYCTDFLVVQRALAAENEAASKRTPIIGAYPKILLGALALFPGLLALAIVPGLGQGGGIENSYNMAVPYTMAYYFPTGLLGLGLVALMASFMSGMAGGVTAFNTIFTYDIYRTYLKRNASDRHYLLVGRIATVVGVMLSVGAAYIVLNFTNIINYLQLLNGLFLVPPFAIFLLGVFWKGSTPWGGFAGLVGGLFGYLGLYGLYKAGRLDLGSELGADLWLAWWGFVISTVLTVVVSLLTRRGRLPDNQLRGLVWALLDRRPGYEPKWFKRPWVLSTGVLVIVVGLNVYFF
jgi:solute:Na+ symporter, SSS family